MKRAVTAVIVVGALIISIAAATADETPLLAGRTLTEAIATLRSQGLRVVYSDALVRPDMRVKDEPPKGSPRQQLAAILLPHGLALKEGPRRSLMVVKGAEGSEVTGTPAEKPAETPPPALQYYREDVLVESSKRAEPDTTAHVDVRPQAVVAMAGGAENVFRVLHTLPGVVAPEEFGSRIAVRGGGPDQNLTILDGVEIHNPYRIFGVVTAFNPETVESFEFRAGAFSARYGDRLSSLLTVETRRGTTEQVLSGSAALSITDANLILEGKLPKGRGSWLLGGRRTYYDLIVERTNSDDGDYPSFGDLQAKLVWDLGRNHRVTAVAQRSREGMDYQDEGSERFPQRQAFNFDIKGDLYALSHRAVFGRRLSARTILSLYDDRRLMESDQLNLLADRTPDPTDVTNFEFESDQRVRDAALRHDTTLQLSPRHTLATGFEIHRLETHLGWTLEGSRDATAGNRSPYALIYVANPMGAGLAGDLDSTRDSTRAAAWLEDRFEMSPRFGIQVGARLEHSGINGETSVSPRLSAAWTLAADTRLHAAAGLYTQSPGYEKLYQDDYFIDLTARGRLPLQNERARHLLVGVEQEVPEWGLLARVEGYYKVFDRMIVGRLESEEERLARVATYDFPADLRSSVPSAAQITSDPTNGGRGHAYGFDFYLQLKPKGALDMSGWVSYTYGFAKQTAYGHTFPGDYDRRHAVSAVALIPMGPSFSLSVTARVASGTPRTPYVGARVADQADTADVDGDGNRAERIPVRDARGNFVYTSAWSGVAQLNSRWRPDFSRCDVRFAWLPKQGRHFSLYLDVFNIFARNNVLGHEQSPNSNTPERSIDGLPIVPSLGAHVRF